jgi:hypothetical protein
MGRGLAGPAEFNPFLLVIDVAATTMILFAVLRFLWRR